MKEESSPTPKLYTTAFICLNMAMFLAFVNLAVFFQFYDYLQALNIDPAWFGLLIGIFSAVSLVVRPVISPYFHSDNSLQWAMISTLAVASALAMYSLTSGHMGIILVRTWHGLGHVTLSVTLLALLVAHIPEKASGRAFGVFSIIVVLPYAVVPPALPYLVNWLGSLPGVLIFFALIMLLLLPLIWVSRPRSPRHGAEKTSVRPSGREIWDNLKDPKTIILLTVDLIFYSGYALIFFYLDSYGKKIGIENAGFFFTLSTFSEIGVRFFGGKWFDAMNKGKLAGWSLVGLTLGYIVLAHAPGRIVFYALGIYLGVGWGVIMPILNAWLFDISPPRLKAFNTNLGVQMLQGGYFVGPLIGGFVLSGYGYTALFYTAVGLTLLATGLAFYLVGKTKGG